MTMIHHSTLFVISLMAALTGATGAVFGDVRPTEIAFTRQAAQRLVFDAAQDIPLWSLDPKQIVGLEVMHPSVALNDATPPRYTIENGRLTIQSDTPSQGALWLGGMNPFVGHLLAIDTLVGEGMTGFDFASPDGMERLSVLLAFENGKPVSIVFAATHEGKQTHRQTLHTFEKNAPAPPFDLRLQMLGSGFTVFIHKDDLPQPVGQINDFNTHLELRRKKAIASYQTRLLTDLKKNSAVVVKQAHAAIDTGVGLADVRAITYQDGRPYLERNRLWYTMSIRGRALPQHIQGVLSLDPSVFDLKLEGIILFDRGDGLLRNEIASHIFYDEHAKTWRGVTTGFTAFADHTEDKQLLAVQSPKDPRFGISVMQAWPMGLVGDYEDAHLLYDTDAKKWRMLLCENHKGYKAVMRQSDRWNGDYQPLGDPVQVDSTGTVIQKIGDSRYCLFGSAARQMFVAGYAEVKPLGHIQMDLPPWSQTSGTRIWANLVPLPPGYPTRYVLLTMDRFNYPGLTGPNWSYGALYLYHGRSPDGDDHPYEYPTD